MVRAFLKVVFGHLKLLLSRATDSQEGQCCGMYLCSAHLYLTEEGLGVCAAGNPWGLKCSFLKAQCSRAPDNANPQATTPPAIHSRCN